MNLENFIAQNNPSLQQIRRDIHAHPELAYEEQRTSDLVAQQLTAWGIPVVRNIGVTGVIGIIEGTQYQKESSPAIGLRADMDALPIQESNTFSHASHRPGIMHACGHDGHTAMLLGAAHYLAQHRDFAGTVYLIFQPAEEGGRGDHSGAQKMIEEGLFTRFPMQAIFGMHNWPGLPVGQFGVRTGPMMASSNEFQIVVRGKGAHAAQPHKGIDPIMVAIQIAQSWQTIITRNRNPADQAVLSITQIHAGSATNIIPDAATLIGTVRTFSLATLDLIEQRMRDIATHTASAFGAEIDFAFSRNYPPLVNHAKETEWAIQVMRSIVGTPQVEIHIEPTMGAEDFAFMLQSTPGCYVFIGNGEIEHRDVGHGLGPCTLHNSSYDFNDALLPLGTTYWVRLVQHFFKHVSSK